MKFGTWKPRLYWNGEKYVPSVTTVCSVLDKPALKQWSADEAVKHLDTYYPIVPKTDPKFNLEFHKQILEEARFAYKNISQDAMDIGTRVHECCELFMTGKEVTFSLPEEQDLKILFDAFVVWFNKHNVKPIAIECRVFGLDYSGRVDLVCEIDSFWMTPGWCKDNDITYYKGIRSQRVVVLIDFKTGKGAYYPEWPLQTAGYRAPFNECTIDYHGVLKFNKKTLKVNYKDYNMTYTADLAAFYNLVDFYHHQCMPDALKSESTQFIGGPNAT